MNETTMELGEVSAQDIKAIRQADWVCFFHTPVDAIRQSNHACLFPGDGGSIKCIKKVGNPGPFGASERDYLIPVRSEFSGRFQARMDIDNDTEGERVGPDNAGCFAMEHNAKWSEEWQTVAHFLKAGDVITLAWSADGIANGYLRGAKVAQGNEHGAGMFLHGDTLRLKIKRGDKRFAFLIDVSCCPDNSARMIRRR